MKILINCINLLSDSQGSGGAGKYVYSLVSGLAKISDVRVLVQPHNFLRFQKIRGIQVIPLVDNNSRAIHDNMSWGDVYLCPLNELVPNYIDSRIPVVSCILDLQHEKYPQFFKGGIYDARRSYYGYAISRSDAVITISNHEKELIQKVYGKQEVYVTYLAGYLASEFDLDFLQSNIANEFNIPENPYLIYPAIPWRHKNHYRLIEALWILKREYHQLSNIKLILTGSQKHNLNSSHFLDKIINDLDMQDSVDIRGFISDAELAILIKKAKLMVFPSLYEGFGIPIVDAMNFGTPVLTTSLSSIPEICQDAVAYLQDPFNSKLIAHDMAKLLMDEDKLLHLSNLGLKQGHQYSLQKTANDTLKILTEVVNKYRSSGCMNFVTAKSAEQYNRNKIQRLTLLINFISQDNLIHLEKEEHLDIFYQSLKKYIPFCNIINILPFETKFKNHDYKFDRAYNVYSTKENTSHYLNVFSYIIDSLVETDYLMYCPYGIKLDNLDISQAITTLDICSDLAAVSFNNKMKYPKVVHPFEGKKLLNQFKLWKTKPLDFFKLKLLRVSMQNEHENLSTLKFLSYFLGNLRYLDFPVRDR
ncbi:glycosyltransferase family 4 protein [Anabaena azotica]|uniref:Glycosyltransferase family 4 protein n=1 Tax=Anabaena azotica FACHB-119 TaxID=947527 RepID=A0ABR8D1L0_9NOST|nr:glycosyltransferase family 1 protein [Anabaena azotica]MBD2501059.1 glycosyltransferase family 4 protein [Anabaena azotica FACHB-119]